MLGMGFVYNYSGLLAARWFLGLAEAACFRGSTTTCRAGISDPSWHSGRECFKPLFVSRFVPSLCFLHAPCHRRLVPAAGRAHILRRTPLTCSRVTSQAVFFSAAAVSGSFGGLLAAAIELMNGIGGRPGWAWIFILEGLLTVIFGFLSFWMVHDFPDEARFLSPEDRARVVLRLKQDQQSSARARGVPHVVSLVAPARLEDVAGHGHLHGLRHAPVRLLAVPALHH